MKDQQFFLGALVQLVQVLYILVNLTEEFKSGILLMYLTKKSKISLLVVKTASQPWSSIKKAMSYLSEISKVLCIF